MKNHNFQQASSNQTDAVIEAQPLWEYPCRALAVPKQVMLVDFADFLQKQEQTVQWTFGTTGQCNGIAVWTDWLLDGTETTAVTSGPNAPVTIGEIVAWDVHSRQGVHLLPHVSDVQPTMQLICDTSFLPGDGNLDFKFKIK